MISEPATEESFLAEIRAFITEELPRRHTKFQLTPLPGDEDPLFETGLLDSLAIVHLVTFLEERIGRPLTLQEVTMSSFKNIRSIAARFAKELP